MRGLLLVLLVGCSTTTLRVGAYVENGHPAFEASMEMGISAGERHAIQITHEHGVSAGSHANYVASLNADYVSIDPDVGPIARIGARVRATNDTAAVMARGAFFTGIARDARDRSGGLGVEIGGGLDTQTMQPAYEASIVMHGRWRVD